MKRGLTQKQQDILDFIDEFQRRESMAPTNYEIAERFRIKPATAFAHLRALQRKGYIVRSSKARSLSLTSHTTTKHLSLSLSIPILGRISAGQPLLAEQNIEESIRLDPALLPRGIGGHRLFGLRVKGDSMIDVGVFDADIVVAKEQNTAEIGNIVVALVEDEATVKSFYLADGKIELRPANRKMKSQFYDYHQIMIQGKIVALYRTFKN
jgi:repressor LexA